MFLLVLIFNNEKFILKNKIKNQNLIIEPDLSRCKYQNISYN